MLLLGEGEIYALGEGEIYAIVGGGGDICYCWGRGEGGGGEICYWGGGGRYMQLTGI